MKKKRKKNARWRRPRHRLVRNVASLIFSPVVRRKYGVRVERCSEQGKRPYFILFNHQTAYDQFFVGMAFRGPVYYVASEDLFSDGFVSSLIRYLVAPIPIRKQTTDVRAIMNCIKVAKEGGTIAIAPEGNRTYSGRTGYMSPAVASLAKKLGLPIAIYRIEGGSFTEIQVHKRGTSYTTRANRDPHHDPNIQTERGYPFDVKRPPDGACWLPAVLPKHPDRRK